MYNYLSIHRTTYICDFLCLLDIFLPLQVVMEAIQSYSVAAWKVVLWLEKLLDFYSCLDFRTLVGCPLLSASKQELEEKSFQDYVYLRYKVLIICNFKFSENMYHFY